MHRSFPLYVCKIVLEEQVTYPRRSMHLCFLPPTCEQIGIRKVAGLDAQCMLVPLPLSVSQVVIELFLTYTQCSIQSCFLPLWVSDIF